MLILVGAHHHAMYVCTVEMREAHISLRVAVFVDVDVVVVAAHCQHRAVWREAHHGNRLLHRPLRAQMFVSSILCDLSADVHKRVSARDAVQALK